MLNCVNIILNVNTLLKPYLPTSCEKVTAWEYKEVKEIKIKPDIKPLYERYDKSRIDEEVSRLQNNK